MAEDRKLSPSVEAGLRRQGVDAVRILVMTGSGPGESAIVPGLFDLDYKRISRADAELWLRRQDAERAEAQEQKEAAAARLDGVWFWLIFGVAFVAALAGVFAAVEGWPSSLTAPR